MEQFLAKVRAYAAARNLSPSTIAQRAGGGAVNGATWARWESGAGSPTLLTADKVLKYIADNPVENKSEVPSCEGE